VISARIEGHEQLVASFRELAEAGSASKARSALVGVMVRALHVFVEAVRARARRSSIPRAFYRGRPRPANPAHMADSVRAAWAPAESNSEVAVQAGPDRDHFWFLFWEFGTRYYAAQPALRPSIETTREQVVDGLAGFFVERMARVLTRRKWRRA
jgi:hypothetical protein